MKIIGPTESASSNLSFQLYLLPPSTINPSATSAPLR